MIMRKGDDSSKKWKWKKSHKTDDRMHGSQKSNYSELRRSTLLFDALQILRIQANDKMKKTRFTPHTYTQNVCKRLTQNKSVCLMKMSTHKIRSNKKIEAIALCQCAYFYINFTKDFIFQSRKKSHCRW